MKKELSVLIIICLLLTTLPLTPYTIRGYAVEDVTTEGMRSGGKEFPKISKQEIIDLLNANPNTTPKDAFDEPPSCTAPYSTGKVKQSVLQAATDRLNALRTLAGLPTVTLDDDMSANAQYGAVLLATLDKLDHRPEQPDDMPDDFYKSAYQATTSSNLGGADICIAPDYAMDDNGTSPSSVANLPTMGHRRWQLNPTMGKVGFGYAKSDSGQPYTVEKVFDKSGKGCDYDFISWPASGNFPNGKFFWTASAWTITLNPHKYQIPLLEDISITLTRKSDGKMWLFTKDDEIFSHTGKYLSIDYGSYGTNNCIIFRPDTRSLDGQYKGKYTVSVHGLKTHSGESIDNFTYTVDFFDPHFPLEGFTGECGAEGGNLTWALKEDGILTISGTGKMKDFHHSKEKSPWYAEISRIKSLVISEGVTSVGTDAFYDCHISSAYLPNSITAIGESAFEGCRYLSTLNIPNSVISIGSSAFENCTDIVSVKLPSQISTISDNLFAYCKKLSAIVIPENVTSIGHAAFYGCSSLTNVTIPCNVTNIDGKAFYGCSALTDISIPGNVSKIGEVGDRWLSSERDAVFAGCKSLVSIRVDQSNNNFIDVDGVLFTKDMDKLIQYPCGRVSRAYIITDGVTQIGKSAFQSCFALNSITLPGSIMSIGREAFLNCDALKDTYFIGNESQWKRIKIDSNNKNLTDATIHYKPNTSTIEPTPTPVPTTAPTITPTVTPLPTASPVPKPEFTDVKENAYYAQPVAWAIENGITSGIGMGKFGPENSCTRGQIVTFLWRAAGSPNPKTIVNPFTDVKSTDYYYKAVLWAVENNITSGVGKGKFGPGNSCTRGQAVTFLWRAAGSPNADSTGKSFTDVKAGSYYERAVNWAVANKITSGTGANTFSPDNSCTRGQIVTFLYRADG